MTTTNDEEGAMTVPQWILKMYPQQTTVILYEAILNGRLVLFVLRRDLDDKHPCFQLIVGS